MRANAWRIISNNVGAVATANVVSLVCALAQVPLLTHRLTPVEFATITAAIALGTYASIAQGDALSLALQRFPGETSNRQNYAYARLRLVIGLLIGWAIAVPLGLALGQFWLFIAIASWGAGLASMRLTSVAWLMWHKPWRYSMTLAISTTLRTVILGTLVIVGRSPMEALVVAGLVSAVVGLVLGPRAGSTGRSGPKRPWPQGFGVSLALGSAGTAVLLNLDRAVAPLLLVGDEAGVYAAMSTLAMVTVGAALVSLRTVVYPIVVRAWASDRSTALRRSDQTLVLSAAVVLILFFLANIAKPRWIAFLIPADLYDPGLAPVLILAYLAYALGQHGTWWHSLNLQARTIRNLTLLAAAVMCVLVPVLGSTLGGQGVALAMATSASIYAIMLTWDSPIRRVTQILTGIIVAYSASSLINSAAENLASILATILIALTACLFALGSRARILTGAVRSERKGDAP